MPVLTLEGVVEHGQLKLTTRVPLPDNTKVSVVISDLQHEPRARLVSPRLVHPEQIAECQMEVSKDSGNDDV